MTARTFSRALRCPNSLGFSLEELVKGIGWLTYQLYPVTETARLGQSEMASYSSILICYSTVLKLPSPRSSYKDHFILSAKGWVGEGAAKTWSGWGSWASFYASKLTKGTFQKLALVLFLLFKNSDNNE